MSITFDDMDNSELADLYHMCGDARRHCNKNIGNVLSKWAGIIADAYDTRPKHTIVFSDQDVGVLIEMANMCKEHVNDYRRVKMASTIINSVRE